MKKLFKVRPELIVIHVPKTAGSTLYKVLKKSYGLGMERINEDKDVEKWNHGLAYASNSPFTKAIYGHIQAHPNWTKLYPEAKLVTWLRDPVERVVSTYYHWKSNKSGPSKRQLEFSRDNLSLMDFVNSEKYRPIVFGYETYLGGIETSQYDFVGRTEHFEEDLLRFQNIIGRKLKFVGQKENTNQQKPKIDDSQRQEIANIISSEYKLYHKLLAQNGQAKDS